MKRFYKFVSLKDDGGFSVLLDGKPVKTPAKQTLLIAGERAANLVMREWAAQEENIKPDTMPAMQWCVTAQDIVSRNREAAQKSIIKFLDTDLIRYRSENEPYKERQILCWDPVIAWTEDFFAASFTITSELKPLAGDETAHRQVQSYLQRMEVLKLTVLQSLTEETGSLLLAAAFIEGQMTPDDLLKAALLEDFIKAEIYNEDFYGPAPGQEKKRADLLRSFAAAGQMFRAL